MSFQALLTVDEGINETKKQNATKSSDIKLFFILLSVITVAVTIVALLLPNADILNNLWVQIIATIVQIIVEFCVSYSKIVRNFWTMMIVVILSITITMFIMCVFRSEIVYNKKTKKFKRKEIAATVIYFVLLSIPFVVLADVFDIGTMTNKIMDEMKKDAT